MTMEKIIFLDIDGVLNRSYTEHELKLLKDREHWTKEVLDHIYGLNPDLVKNLKKAVDATDAKIVVSSSWRPFKDHPTTGEDWRKSLAEMLGKDVSIFIGDTPILGGNNDRRGREIRSWIADNQFSGKFCVIDDDIEDIIGVIPRSQIVETSTFKGLTEEKADEAISVLNS